MNLFLPNGSFGDESIVPLAPFEKMSGQLKLTWKRSAQTKLSLTSFLTEKTYRNFDSYYKYNPDGINWNYEKDLSYIFDITRSISSKTFYEFKFLNFSCFSYVSKSNKTAERFDPNTSIIFFLKKK